MAAGRVGGVATPPPPPCLCGWVGVCVCFPLVTPLNEATNKRTAVFVRRKHSAAAILYDLDVLEHLSLSLYRINSFTSSTVTGSFGSSAVGKTNGEQVCDALESVNLRFTRHLELWNSTRVDTWNGLEDQLDWIDGPQLDLEDPLCHRPVLFRQ